MSKLPERTAWERIQEALIDAGYEGTQKEVESVIEIKQGSVSGWNKVGGSPSLPNAIAIGLKLNVCVEWILTERGPKRPGPPMEKTARELWDAWGRISADDRSEILGFAKAKAHPTTRAARQRGK